MKQKTIKGHAYSVLNCPLTDPKVRPKVIMGSRVGDRWC